MKAVLVSVWCFLMTTSLSAQQKDVVYSFEMLPINTSLPVETRSYTVALPSGYNAAEPSAVILNLHAYYESITDFRQQLSIDSIAEANNVVVVYPQGDICTWVYKPLPFLPNSGTGWNAGIINGDFDDVAFLSRVLDSVMVNYHIDTNKVYCMGVSNGAFMATKMVAEMGHRFAAAASVIGFDTTIPKSTVPFLSILGGKDTISRLNGIKDVQAPWSQVRAKWLAVNTCDAEFIATMLPDIDANDKSWVEKRTYKGCNKHGAFVEYIIGNGGHHIPNTGPCTAPPVVCDALGPVNNDIDPSVEIWNFFKGATAVSMEPIMKGEIRVDVFPNPTQGIVHFNFSDAPIPYRLTLFSSQGEVLLERILPKGVSEFTWTPNERVPGIYIYRAYGKTGVKKGKIQLY